MYRYHDKQPTHKYNDLSVGQSVACQNVKNRKRDRTRVIKEVMKFRQYKVVLNGSGRISLRNRIHLKPLLHVKSPLVFSGGRNEVPTPTPVPAVDRDMALEPVQPQEQPQGVRPPLRSPRRLSPKPSNRPRRKPVRFGDWCM